MDLHSLAINIILDSFINNQILSSDVSIIDTIWIFYERRTKVILFQFATMGTSGSKEKKEVAKSTIKWTARGGRAGRYSKYYNAADDDYDGIDDTLDEKIEEIVSNGEYSNSDLNELIPRMLHRMDETKWDVLDNRQQISELGDQRALSWGVLAAIIVVLGFAAFGAYMVINNNVN